MNRRRPAVLALALLVAWPAAADVADTEPEWKVGIASFDVTTVQLENAYLGHSIPLLLRERLRAVPTHHLDAEGRLALGRAVLARKARELAASLRTLRTERDGLLFSPSAGRAEKVAQYDEKIAGVLEELASLRQRSPEQVEVPESKPVRLVEGNEGRLLEAAVHSAVEAAREGALDLLVWGSLEQLQEYVYLEAQAFDAARGRVVLRFREAASVEGVREVVAHLGDELARLVWGREWASLSVRSEPAGALVWVDDRFVGRSPVELEFVLPGPISLRVESPGWEPAQSEFDLPAFASLERVLTLQERERPRLSLSSTPPEAAVYVGAEWVGSTPLELPRPEGDNRLLLRKEGYLDTSVYLGESGPSELALDLLPRDRDPPKQQAALRDRFYRAFGLFALSVPVPYLCWAYAGDYAVSYAATSDPELWSTAQAFYRGYLGGLAVSSGLFANMLIRLVRYVRAADRKA